MPRVCQPRAAPFELDFAIPHESSRFRVVGDDGLRSTKLQILDPALDERPSWVAERSALALTTRHTLSNCQSSTAHPSGFDVGCPVFQLAPIILRPLVMLLQFGEHEVVEEDRPCMQTANSLASRSRSRRTGKFSAR